MDFLGESCKYKFDKVPDKIVSFLKNFDIKMN